MKTINMLISTIGIIIIWTCSIYNFIEAGKLHSQNFESIDAIYHILEAVLLILVIIACKSRSD